MRRNRGGKVRGESGRRNAGEGRGLVLLVLVVYLRIHHWVYRVLILWLAWDTLHWLRNSVRVIALFVLNLWYDASGLISNYLLLRMLTHCFW